MFLFLFPNVGVRPQFPILIRIDTKAGHGAGKPTAKVIEEVADRWGFLARALKMTEPAKVAAK